mmetsp:Transcript_38523/g.46551  ORF Transcript_38523/g.46551 Transcript_38523/m.46551 type:complete len:623 (+) Transcript_38523:165-2033(+)
MATENPINVTAEVDYKEKAALLINEYFNSADVDDVAANLEEMDKPLYQYYFAKHAIKLAMDRTNREKEMVAQLLTNLCEEDIILPGQVSKAFVQLLENVSDMQLDVPDAPRVLALFLVRAQVDDILPKPFLRVCAGSLQDDTAKAVANDALTMLADKHNVEDMIMRVWGEPTGISADAAQKEVESLVVEHIQSGCSVDEVQRRLKDLNLPFFHHEFVKCVVLAASQSEKDRPQLSTLLKALVDCRQLSTSQVAKGFGRARQHCTTDESKSGQLEQVDALEELCRRQGLFDTLMETDVAPETPSEIPPSPANSEERFFKEQSESIVREYFSSSSIEDARASLLDLLENRLQNRPRGASLSEEVTRPRAASTDTHKRSLVKHFVKRCVTVALDHTNREKEMAAQLLSGLYPDVVTSHALQEGYIQLCEGVEDLALDIPDAAHEVAVFLARGVVDDALPPVFVQEMHQKLKKSKKSEDVAVIASVLLGARHSAERVLRMWGGSSVGTVAHSKAGMAVLLKEYLISKDVEEARRCLRALSVPHFHHEFVKRALVYAIESMAAYQELVLKLLKVLAESGDISVSQMAQGFERMTEGIEDLSLDVPGAQKFFNDLKQKSVQLKIIEPV